MTQTCRAEKGSENTVQHVAEAQRTHSAMLYREHRVHIAANVQHLRAIDTPEQQGASVEVSSVQRSATTARTSWRGAGVLTLNQVATTLPPWRPSRCRLASDHQCSAQMARCEQPWPSQVCVGMRQLTKDDPGTWYTLNMPDGSWVWGTSGGSGSRITTGWCSATVGQLSATTISTTTHGAAGTYNTGRHAQRRDKVLQATDGATDDEVTTQEGGIHHLSDAAVEGICNDTRQQWRMSEQGRNSRHWLNGVDIPPLRRGGYIRFSAVPSAPEAALAGV